MLTLALDIGGTTISAGLVDVGGALAHAGTRPTPAGENAEAVWAVVARLIADAMRWAGGVVAAVGVACSGPVDVASGTVSPINIANWRGFPLRDRIAAVLPGASIWLGVDGMCQALGEQWRGAGRGAGFLLGMVVSTGVGGGLVLGGHPVHGRTGNAGHVGHLVVDQDGQPCACGGRGCVETIASGPAMVRQARASGWSGANAKELAGAAAGGDVIAVEALVRGATALAAAIASVAAVCDLDLVIVGGGIAEAGPLLFDPLRAALPGYAGLGYLAQLQVVPAELGATAGLVGAARLTGAVSLPG